MKRFVFSAAALATAALLTAGLGFAQDAAKPSTPAQSADTTQACMAMMQGAGATDEGRKAMQKFMQSGRAPQAMANMMEMARRMGDGDAMLGMTRMMEMMGSMGDGSMMGGDGDAMRGPGGTAQPPRK
jgi:hypothetical protein